MPGGLMQLLAWGNQNLYLSGNPSITYFKKVYKTFTNFSMETISVTLNRNDILLDDTTMIKATINRHGDLISQMYFVFELPDIVFDDSLLFRWVDNIGEVIIDNCQISINGNVVDKQYGEFNHLYRNLTYGVDKNYMYEKMVGQRAIPDKVKPDTPYGALIQTYHPKKISSRKIYVPMNFWFNRTLAQGLPLIGLQYSEVELNIALRPFRDLYQLYYVKNGVSDWYAPNLALSSHQFPSFVDLTTNRRFLISDNVMDIKAYVDVNYVFLDKAERNFFLYQPTEYLIEQTTRIDKIGIPESAVLDLILQNPVKEIMWVCSRNDKKVRNNWFEYTDGDSQIMQTAKIMFNGLDRFDAKDAVYFNYVQPFQHHRANYKDGLFVYSFAINADDIEQPSGACNMSMINKIQMLMTNKRPNDDSYQYDVTFYIISYNLLRIEKGLGSVAFSK